MTEKLRPAWQVRGELETRIASDPPGDCYLDDGAVTIITADRAAVVDLLEEELRRPKRDYLTWYDLEQALARVRKRLSLPARRGGGG